MGVVNVTPDSFSDGGLWLDADAAIRQGLALVADGADLVDVGGESTRPGAGRISAQEELRRVLPVVEGLADAGVVVSIDTMRAEVADEALACGAALVNDVSGGQADPAMPQLAADARVPFVAMHWRGASDRMEQLAVYDDVVADVRDELARRLEALVAAGVDEDRIVLDPGFGFAKRAEHGWALLAHLDALAALGRPLLVGTSRKRFLASAVAAPSSPTGTGGARRTGTPPPPPPPRWPRPPARGRCGCTRHVVPPTPSAWSRQSPRLAARRRRRRREHSFERQLRGSDRILLTGLVARGHHGVFDSERRDGQDFAVDVVLELDLRGAAATDDLTRTVHYGELARALADDVRGEPVDLLETLADRLLRTCLANPRVEAAEVVVHKPHAPIEETFGDVAVAVRRTREELFPPPRDGILALGSNLGDRERTLAAAVADLAGTPGLEVAAVSPVVETAPVGGPQQPDYLNAVVEVRGTLTPHALLGACLAVEARHGREREVRWGARTLDVDVITYGDLVLDGPDLVLPHPRAAYRAFVLAPWAALDPRASLPVPSLGPVARARVADLLADLPADGVRLRPDVVLEVPA